MDPSEKSPEMNSFLESIAPGRQDSIRDNRCVFCKNPASDFRDSLSRKEFSISGLCQGCQDSVFGVDKD